MVVMIDGPYKSCNAKVTFEFQISHCEAHILQAILQQPVLPDADESTTHSPSADLTVSLVSVPLF